MELLSRLSTPNELTPEVIAKAEMYRNDVTSAKIKPEYILMEKFCTDEHWKKEITPIVIDKKPEETKESSETANTEKSNEEISEANDSNKHPLAEGDKVESDNKKLKTVRFRRILKLIIKL